MGLAFLQIFFLSASLSAVSNFREAKRYLERHLDLFDSKTIYCGCAVGKRRVDLRSCGYKARKNAKRAARVEWEHVVPAEAFGNSFAEWREGSPRCRKRGKTFKGRKCAETNAEFARMEGDLYNLFPEIGELNGLRSNFSMAAIAGPAGKFGDCAVKLEDRKFEPSDAAKGVVARTYLHMDRRYPGRGIVSDKNEKLFAAWDRMFPVTPLECRRWKALEKMAGYPHRFADRCKPAPAPISGP